MPQYTSSMKIHFETSCFKKEKCNQIIIIVRKLQILIKFMVQLDQTLKPGFTTEHKRFLFHASVVYSSIDAYLKVKSKQVTVA